MLRFQTTVKVLPRKTYVLYSTFFRASQDKTIQGHGIGVAFVRKIIEYHKGGVKVVSELRLTTPGYNVHFHTSLAGIKNIIEQFSPLIIILDVEIGNENSIERAQEIISRFLSIPLLFISSHTDISFISQGLALGAVSYLKKPFDIRELDVYIQRFAQQKSTSK